MSLGMLEKSKTATKFRLTLTEELLGAQAANKKIHNDFIASKSKDAKDLEEELAALPAEELMVRATTVFHRDADGMPVLFNYQIKGFIKEAVGAMIELPAYPKNAITLGKTKLSKWSHKRLVDKFIFVYPRMIKLAPLGEPCTRPLRAETQQGDRVALATSETVPAGTVLEIQVETYHPVLNDLIEECFIYGGLSGLGQWRNAGKGTFSWAKMD